MNRAAKRRVGVGPFVVAGLAGRLLAYTNTDSL
jgi:hypothetical protein